MKQLTKVGMLLAFGGILASCSNDNIDNPNLTPQPVDGEGMFMTVNIGLPASDGTRGSFGGYEEGLENEYAVNKVQLYLFKYVGGQESEEAGETDPDGKAVLVESTADFTNPITLGYSALAGDDAIDVTKSFNATFQIPNSVIKLDKTSKLPSGGETYYGLLVVNGGTDVPDFTKVSGDKTFNNWNAQVMVSNAGVGVDYTDIMKDGNYFTMMNAPVATGTKAQTLVKIDTKQFAVSPAAAAVTPPAATFNVQRGVAKVKLSNGATDATWATMPVQHGTVTTPPTTDKVNVIGWELDNINKASFPAQNVYGTDGNKGFSTWSGAYFTAAGSGTQALNNHIWWAIDPNYFKDATDTENYPYIYSLNNQYSQEVSKKPAYVANDATTFAYCLENTMNYDQMMKSQTTRIVFKAKYILDLTKFVGVDLGDNNANYAGFIVYNDKAYPVNKDDLADGAAAGAKQALSAVIEESKLEKYRAALMMGGYTDKVTYYENGETYYVSYIRHFDDSETDVPAAWQSNGTKDLSDLTQTDLAEWSAQLGRYGVLRNNVYDIKVMGFNGFGSPTFPDDPTPDEPDDKEPEIKYNALVAVNVLHWAVRNNNYYPR